VTFDRRSALFALAALLAGCDKPGSAGGSPASFKAVDITGAEYARTLSLQDPDGKTRTLADFKGKVTVVFFGYTHCPDVCPTTLADFAHVRRELGPRAERVRFVFVTVDPARDTPADVMRYARAFDSTFVGLSTDSASLAPIMRGFGVGAYREPGGDAHTYTVAHTASVFVIDPEGRLREPVRFGPQRADALLRAVEEALE
jgi:protein SCO1/2